MVIRFAAWVLFFPIAAAAGAALVNGRVGIGVALGALTAVVLTVEYWAARLADVFAERDRRG